MGLAGFGEGQAQQDRGASLVAARGDGTVAVSRLRVTGSTVFPAETLRALLAPEEGKELTLAEIEALAGRITALYRGAGYVLARAYVPPQEIRDGVVEIAVVEGRIGAVEVRGGTRYDPEVLRSYLAPPAESPAFRLGRHERGMLLLNDLPGFEVKSTLKPGAEPATTDIVLDVEKDRLITGSLDANNYGSRLTGRERFSLSLNLNNPFGWGDTASFRGMMSRNVGDLWFVRFSYSLPLGTLGTRVGASFTRLESQVGAEFRDLGLLGAGDVVSLYAVHPFLRSRNFSVYGQAGFDYKDFQTDVLGTPISKDHLRVLSLGGVVEAIDPWRGANTVSLTLHQGIGGFLGGLRGGDDPNTSRAGAGGTFTKLTGEATRVQSLMGPTSLFGKVGGQWAAGRLVSAEQFIIGGNGAVRGYPIAEAAGDHGYTATLEFRWNAPGFSEVPAFWGKRWGEILQVFGFVDHGLVAVIDPLPGQQSTTRLTGAGAGIRFGIPDNFHLKLEYAKPVGKARPSDGREDVFYFLATKWF